MPEHAKGRSPHVVAMVTDAVYPYHVGGKEIRYHHLSRGLAGRGLEVHVFTMHWWDGPRHRVEAGVHLHALCRRRPLYHGKRRSILEAVVFALACLRLVVYRFDLLEADDMPLLQLFTLRAVAGLRRVPLVVTWHEFWGRDAWRAYLGRAGVLAARVERAALRVGDVLVTPSPGTRGRLLAEGVPPDRVEVVPNGLDLALLASVAPSPLGFDLLYVGRLIEHKHVDHLLLAAAELSRCGREVSCGVVGEGPELAALQALAGDLGLRAVRFLGTFAEQRDVLALMKSARVLVLPSTREGYGIVVAEAIACGLPVVTTDHPDNHARALVEAGVTGWLCQATVPGLTRAIGEALSAPAAAPGIRPATAERFGWAARTDALFEVFRSAGKGRADG